MTAEEQITEMKKAIAQAIKVMGDRFGSTEQDVARAIQQLKGSMHGASELNLLRSNGPQTDGKSLQATQATIGTQ